MTPTLTRHADYIERYGLTRWVLRECIRANPLYVISAALLLHGVTLLNKELDPQIGKLGGIVVSLALLHVYELAVLASATIVLKQRTGGGGDLHGLSLVGALFLGGSFLQLDELISMYPRLGLVLVPAALVLAWIKLAWYARLPGVFLPLRYRATALAVLTAHTLSPLLGAPAVKFSIGVEAAQGLSWLCGWVSLLPSLWLISVESRRLAQSDPMAYGGGSVDLDPLVTPRCGTGLLVMLIGTGIAHLYTADWIFDRTPDRLLVLPALLTLGALVVLLRWRKTPTLDFWNTVLIFAPALLVQWVWSKRWPAESEMTLTAFVGAAAQVWLAAVAFYVGLAWTTGRRTFYAGLLGPVVAPSWALLSRARASTPLVRALASAGLGFLCMIAGVVVSLYRERLLRWLDPQEAKE